MKFIKNFLFVICFLSAFSVTAYCGSGQCQCSAGNPPNFNRTDYKDIPVYIGPGYGVAWSLYIETHAEIEPSIAGAQIMGFADPNPNPYLYHYDNCQYCMPIHVETLSGSAFSYNGVTIHLVCVAQNLALSGEAKGNVIVQW